MIIFNRDKEKKITFKMDLSGIERSMLEYHIRLSSNTADYGFKGVEKNGLLEFTIPALSGILKESEIRNLKYPDDLIITVFNDFNDFDLISKTTMIQPSGETVATISFDYITH